MKKSLSLAIIILLITGACTNFSNLDVRSVKLSKFTLVNTSKARIEFDYTINNPTSSTFILSSGEGVIAKKGLDFAQLEIMKGDTIPPRTLKSGKVSIDAMLLDPISLLSMGLNIASWRVEDFHVSSKIVIKTSSGHKRTVRFKNVPLQNLINRL